MKGGGAQFSRLRALMTAVAAAVMGLGPKASNAERQAVQNAGFVGYKSRGKGGKRPHSPTGIAKVKRAALKAKNRANHRRHA